MESILALPADKQNLLIFRHCYNHSFDDMEVLLDTENARGEYINLVILLSESLGMENKLISDYSMDKVCDKVLKIIAEEYQGLTKEISKGNTIDKDDLNVEITYIPEGFELKNNALFEQGDILMKIHKYKFIKNRGIVW